MAPARPDTKATRGRAGRCCGGSAPHTAGRPTTAAPHGPAAADQDDDDDDDENDGAKRRGGRRRRTAAQGGSGGTGAAVRTADRRPTEGGGGAARPPRPDGRRRAEHRPMGGDRRGGVRRPAANQSRPAEAPPTLAPGSLGQPWPCGSAAVRSPTRNRPATGGRRRRVTRSSASPRPTYNTIATTIASRFISSVDGVGNRNPVIGGKTRSFLEKKETR